MGPPLQISGSADGVPETGVKIGLSGDVTKVQNVKYVIVNQSAETFRFISCTHGYRGRQVEVTLKDQYNVTKGAIWSLSPSDSCWVKVQLIPKMECGMYLHVAFSFKASSGTDLKIIRDITYDCVSSDYKLVRMFNQLAPQEEEESDEEDEEVFADLKLIEYKMWVGYGGGGGSDNSKLVTYSCTTTFPSGFVPWGGSSLESTLELDDYHVPTYVRHLVRSQHTPGKMDEIRDKLGIRALSYRNYDSYFHGMLYLEEMQQWKDIKHYTLKRSTLVKDHRPDRHGNTRFRLRIPGLAEKRPSVLRGDRLHIIPLPPQEFKYEGVVDDTSQNDAYLVFDPQFESDIDVEYRKEFRVEFTIDRLTVRLMHRAVDIIKTEEDFQDVVFPNTSHVMSMRNPNDLNIQCFEPRIEDNPEQLSAVKHIVCGTSRPAPYLIYGPPGTGKTTTLVEAIKQVCLDNSSSRILVCAPQNDAADLIAERLLEHVAVNSILRFNAVSRSYMSMSDEILSISNYSAVHQAVTYPVKSEIAKRQIVVATLVSSGRLVSAELNDHFTHIFIDEAGFATEPETAIPLGLLSPRDGQLVLAGDPEQLGPILRSTISADHGFGVSMLERQMKLKMGLYSRDYAGMFNPDFVTELIRNFRSHPDILQVPNELFYDMELEAHADEEDREYFCDWQHLPKLGFPLIFHRVDGREEQELCSPSWFNRHEIVAVTEYVKKLLFGSPKVEPEDIGIISPYIQQVRKIRQALRLIDDNRLAYINADIDEIKVGSVEKFQGNERKVVIISTVRSQTEKLNIDRKFNLGFVKNPKRFNVAITRAKALLIIVGNPLVLCTDEKWRRLISHIVTGGGYVGDPIARQLLEADVDQHINGELEQLELSAAEYDAAGAVPGEMSGYILHQDDQWERRG